MADQLYQEKIHLEKTKQKIDKEFELISNRTEEVENHYTEELRSINPNGAETKEEQLSNLKQYLKDKNYDLVIEQRNKLLHQSGNPYFAHIIFKPEKNDLPLYDVYIGRYSYLNNFPEKPIIDWRSPVASVYYQNISINQNTYFDFVLVDKSKSSSTNNRINGSLTLRRQIEIEDGQIRNIYDSTKDVSPLVRILEEKTGGVLETIIQSIQSEQDAIIRSDIDTPIIVQGTAGSGKTTVAIHKISYLLYTYGEILSKDNILLLLNSPTLIKYVRSALKDLDIVNPNILPLEYVVAEKLSKFKNGYEIKWHSVKKVNQSTIETKKIIGIIQSYCSEYARNMYQQILNLIGTNSAIEPDELVSSRIFEEIDSLISRFEVYLNELIYEEEDKKNPNYENKKILKVNSIIRRLTEIKENFDLTKAYNDFLFNSQLKFKQDEETYFYFMYIFAHELWGEKIPSGKFFYTIVDEGQDYTPLEYEVITRLTYEGRLCIFGDVNQNTSERGINDDWENIARIISQHTNRSVSFNNLKISYRNTKQITNYVSKVLEGFSETKYLPAPFSREGEIPNLINEVSIDNLLKKLIEKVIDMKSSNFKSACIVVKDDEIAKELNQELNRRNIETIVINNNLKDFEINKIYIGTENNVKGLEFSQIFIYDPENIYSDKDKYSARKLYIMCSRGINKVNIYNLLKS